MKLRKDCYPDVYKVFERSYLMETIKPGFVYEVPEFIKQEVLEVGQIFSLFKKDIKIPHSVLSTAIHSYEFVNMLFERTYLRNEKVCVYSRKEMRAIKNCVDELLIAMAETSQTVIHGDVHLLNMIKKEDRLILIDPRNTTYASSHYDIAKWISVRREGTCLEKGIELYASGMNMEVMWGLITWFAFWRSIERAFRMGDNHPGIRINRRVVEKRFLNAIY